MNLPSAFEQTARLLDPDPLEWLTDERLYFLEKNLLLVLNFLDKANLYDNFVSKWVDLEVADEVQFSDDSSKETDKIIEWSRNHWNHKLETLYLQKKEELDSVGCRLLTLENKNFSFEIYHRLKAGEATFDELSMRFGIGPERFRGGRYDMQPLASFPDNLRKTLQSMAPGDLTKPFRFNGGFVILLLETWSPASFDENSQNRLLRWEYEEWRRGMIGVVRDRLNQFNERS